MPIDLHIVDAFTAEPFRGNPAAVCLPDRELADAFMQAVAAEMNLSETAFVVPEGGGWRLRWFTPQGRGRPVRPRDARQRHMLWETGRLDRTTAGNLRHAKRPTDLRRRDDWIEMDFPAEPPVPLDDAAPAPDLAAALNAPGRIVGRKRNRMDYLVELETAAAVRAMAPDFARLAALPARGVIVTARSDDPATISSPASSPRPSASTRTPSPAPPTAASARTGPRSSASRISRAPMLPARRRRPRLGPRRPGPPRRPGGNSATRAAPGEVRGDSGYGLPISGTPD